MPREFLTVMIKMTIVKSSPRPAAGVSCLIHEAPAVFFGVTKMQIATMDSSQKMSSREIADLVESRHDSVKRTIERLVESGIISKPPSVDGEKSANGVTEKIYQIGKRDSYIVVAQLSPEFTARLVDRWQELEEQQAIKVPTTLSGALRLAAEQAEQIEAQQLQLEAQKPAVEFVDRFVEAKSAKGFREVAKIMGIPERKFIADLAENKIIFKQGSNWLPYAHHQALGRFTVKTGDSNGHAFHQCRFTPAGIAWVAQLFSQDNQSHLL
jgi:phage antirepressor YoqD-like protein